jgi:hypothetical protein
MDLEGIVCKRKDSPYKVTEKPSRYWIKVKNSRYSQLEGREDLFEWRTFRLAITAVAGSGIEVRAQRHPATTIRVKPLYSKLNADHLQLVRNQRRCTFP